MTKGLSVYVLGGAVMAIEGLKDGTRDIDVLTEDKAAQEILVESLEKCYYYLLQPQDLSKAYQELSATSLENIDRFRWEIFIKYVGKKLALSGTMMSRAIKMYHGKMLTVYRLSKEDLFLLKGMTERDRDLEDMSLLAESGIDYDIVFDECKRQSESDNRGNIWEASLNEKLKELESSYGVRVPFRKALEKIAEEKMIGLNIVKVLQIESLDETEIYFKLPDLEPDDIKDGLINLIKSERIEKTEDGKFNLVPYPHE